MNLKTLRQWSPQFGFWRWVFAVCVAYLLLEKLFQNGIPHMLGKMYTDYEFACGFCVLWFTVNSCFRSGSVLDCCGQLRPSTGPVLIWISTLIFFISNTFISNEGSTQILLSNWALQSPQPKQLLIWISSKFGSILDEKVWKNMFIQPTLHVPVLA